MTFDYKKAKEFVLIVPLWNWNFGNLGFMFPAPDGLNCTFMELKSAMYRYDM